MRPAWTVQYAKARDFTTCQKLTWGVLKLTPRVTKLTRAFFLVPTLRVGTLL